MSDVPELWMDKARYDLDTAHDMFQAGRYLYVLFCCQQAVEKALKGLIARKTGEFPPRLHNLIRLAEHASMEFDEKRADFLRELSAYYIQARYPEEIENVSAAVSREIAHDMLSKTEEIFKWLSSIQ